MSPPRLRILGSGSALPTRDRTPSGYSLEFGDGATTLLDAGPGTLARFGQHGGSLACLKRICITHFHPDHCLDLAAVLFARHNPAFRELEALEILAPRGIHELLGGLEQVWGSWVSAGDAHVVVLEPGSSYECSDFSLSALPTHHTDTALCFSLRFASGSRLCYSGDSDLVPELIESAGCADVFLCECSFPDDAAQPGHMTPARVAQAAASAGVGRVVLTHFYPECDPQAAQRSVAAHFAGEVIAARDGMQLEISPRGSAMENSEGL